MMILRYISLSILMLEIIFGGLISKWRRDTLLTCVALYGIRAPLISQLYLVIYMYQGLIGEECIYLPL
jgi:hypothetical protein